jgi:hypothetical protein
MFYWHNLYFIVSYPLIHIQTFFYVDISLTSPWTGGMMEGLKVILDTVVLRKVPLVPKIPLLQSQDLYPVFQ